MPTAGSNPVTSARIKAPKGVCMKKIWEQLLPDILTEFKNHGYKLEDDPHSNLIYVHRSTQYRAHHASSTHTISLEVDKSNPVIQVYWSRLVHGARGTVSQRLQGVLTYQKQGGLIVGVLRGVDVDEDAAGKFFYEFKKIIECEYQVQNV